MPAVRITPPVNGVRFGATKELHPEIQKIADDLAKGLQYSFVAAAASPDKPFPAGSVEEAFRKTILAAPESARRDTKRKAEELAGNAARFGRYGRIPLQEYGSLGFAKAQTKLPQLNIDAAKLRPAIEAMKNAPEPAAPEAAPQAQAGIDLHLDRVSGINFLITEVFCNDETDGFLGMETGVDEISIGGLAMNGTAVSPVGAIRMGDFEDNVRKVYPGKGKVFCKIPVKKGGPYPKMYSAVVMMAEVDWGGFSSALASAWVMVMPVLKDAYEKAVKAVLGIVLPQDIADILAEIYVDVVGSIVDTVLGFVFTIFADDLFIPGYAVAKVHTPVGLAYEKPSLNKGGWNQFLSPVGTFKFKGHGGSYTVKCRWQIETAAA